MRMRCQARGMAGAATSPTAHDVCLLCATHRMRASPWRCGAEQRGAAQRCKVSACAVVERRRGSVVGERSGRRARNQSRGRGRLEVKRWRGG